MIILNSKFFTDLTTQARSNSRLRQHVNLHNSYDDPSQRLLSALEPDTYIRPHCHLSEPKPECFIGLHGKMALFIFDDNGNVEHVFPFGPNEENAGADLPPGVWHTVISLEQGSILFETKPGPFDPQAPKDPAPWAPEEGSIEAIVYLEHLRVLVQASS